jgi:hemolysin activation/secretion protein
LAVVVFVLFGFAPYAFVRAAPSAGQLAPASFEPPTSHAPTSYSFPATVDASAPPGAANAFLTVRDFKIDGAEPAFADETEAVLGPLRGRRVRVPALYEAAAKLQAVRAAHGNFLARVVIPPQNVKNGGILEFKALEGFIDAIDVESLAPQVRTRVAALLARVKGRPRLTRIEFERALLLAGDTAGLTLRSSLTPAHVDLGVRLTVTGDYNPVTGQITTDDALSRQLGRFETTVSSSVNSALGQGEQIYASATAASLGGDWFASNPRRLAAAGVSAPIGTDGLGANVEYAWSATDPLDVSGELATASVYQRVTAKLSFPWIKTQNDVLITRLALDEVDERNVARGSDALLYHDRLNVLRAGLDLTNVSSFGSLEIASFDLSQGLPGLGARGAGQATADDPISRAGASDEFTKFEARLRWRQDLPAQFALDITLHGQFTRDPLMNSEKFTIGGPADISGLDLGAFSGDDGWAARVELQHAFATLGPSPTFTPYLFAARGQAWTLDPTAAQSGLVGADSLGFGVRLLFIPTGIFVKEADLAAEAARDIVDKPTASPDAWRIGLSGSLRF